jgi:hypothetical protein
MCRCANVRMCGCADVPMCQCLPDPKGRVRMCGCVPIAIGMPMCRCADVPMPARPKGAGANVRMCPDSYRDAGFADVGRYPFRISLVVLLALSDKSVNPLNPGSNRRCRCAEAADVPMIRKESHNTACAVSLFLNELDITLSNPGADHLGSMMILLTVYKGYKGSLLVDNWKASLKLRFSSSGNAAALQIPKG